MILSVPFVTLKYHMRRSIVKPLISILNTVDNFFGVLNPITLHTANVSTSIIIPVPSGIIAAQKIYRLRKEKFIEDLIQNRKQKIIRIT